MLRLRQIAFVARDLAPVERDIRAVLGIEVAYRDPMVATWGLENAVFPLGRQFLEVVAPTREGTAAGRYLERRGGDGGYMVILQCDDQPVVRARAAQLGIRTAFEHDEPGYRLWQLHPRDSGGSFLEIDFQQGGEDQNGPWHPAGPAWQAAVRTDVVGGIAAAEIQSPDPAALAARWGRLLDRTVTPAEGSGPRRVDLDDAALRFVPLGDDRGEGLSAVELVATDRRRLFAAAERCGRRIADDALLLGGVRFRVVAAGRPPGSPVS